MLDNNREPSMIQEELSDLETLIRKKETLISKYPDKYSLKVGHQSLKNKEEHLLLELKNSYGRYQMDTQYEINISSIMEENIGFPMISGT